MYKDIYLEFASIIEVEYCLISIFFIYVETVFSAMYLNIVASHTFLYLAVKRIDGVFYFGILF